MAEDGQTAPLESEITDIDRAAMEVEKSRAKSRESPTPDREVNRRARKSDRVKEEEAVEAVAAAGGGGSGSRGGGSGEGKASGGNSTPTDEEFDIPDKTTKEIARDMSKLRNDLNREISRRRDLQEEVDLEKKKLSNTLTLVNANSKALQKVLQTLTREGEHNDGNRILIIKKGR
jgi:hypothetical protein